MKRLVVVALCFAAYTGSVTLLGASPSPQPSDAAVPLESAVLGGAPQAGPAPRLEMSEFRAQAPDPKATGAIRTRIAFTSKTLGLIWWKQSKVYVMPDNEYTRWVIASFTDHWLQRTKAFHVDPAVDRCCFLGATTDDDGNASFDHLPPGKYVMFGAYYTQTGHSQFQYVDVPGYDQNGLVVQTSIPTLAFTDTIFETIVTVTPFAIGTGAQAATITPVAVLDEVYR